MERLGRSEHGVRIGDNLGHHQGRLGVGLGVIISLTNVRDKVDDSHRQVHFSGFKFYCRSFFSQGQGQDAQKILTESREQSKEMIEQKTQEAASLAEAIIRKASEATELERQKMLSDVRKEVARLVVATSAKVLSRDLSDAEKQTFSDSAAKELASAGN